MTQKEAEKLIGKLFKYIMKSKNSLSKWTGTIREVHIKTGFTGDRYYKDSYIISGNGIPYKLKEIKILD